MHRVGTLLSIAVLVGCAGEGEAPAPEPAPEAATRPASEATAAAPTAGSSTSEAVVVTVLTTNGADFLGGTAPLKGEWSFSAWVEVGDRAFLFDTGWSPGNVLSNADSMGIDLSVAEDLVLSHNHLDHTGGVETLRTELARRNPKALSRIHVAAGIFASRPGPDGAESNTMIATRERLEALGSEFIVHEEAAEIYPGVWVTGPVPRVHPEKNYPTGADRVVVVDGERVPDDIPESQSLIVLAADGPVFVSGCGHAGLVNTLEYGRSTIDSRAPHAAIGGFHLFNASDETVSWTATQLAAAGLGHLVGGHCTGFETVVRMREIAGLGNERGVIAAIGTRFEAGSGIVPGNINRTPR